MIPKKRNISIIIAVFACLSLSVAEYCKDNTDIPFDDKPVNSDEWDAYFKSLFSSLSKYEVQSDRSRYNVENINVWGQPEKSQGLIVSEENVETFFKKVKSSFDLIRPSYLDGKTLSRVQFEKLNNILEVTLRSKVSISCTKENILVTGHFISLKSVQNYFDAHKSSDPLCKAVEEKQSIKIFALNALFIDAEVDQYMFSSLKKKLPLVFAAPEWQVIGNIKINLSGANGGQYELPPKSPPSNIQHIPKTDPAIESSDQVPKTGKEVGYIGAIGNWVENHHYDGHNKNGVPGLPGKPGGTFIGLGSKFINGKNLTISTAGGSGTAGTNGEAGRVVKKYTIKTINTCGNCGDDTVHECFQVTEDEIIEWLLAGGHGGKKGLGGSTGNLTFIELDENQSGVVKVTGQGRDGQRGMGGRPGMVTNNLKPGQCYLDSNLQKLDTSKFESHLGKEGLHNHVELEYEIPFDFYELSEKKILKEYQDYFRKSFDVNMKDFAELEFIDKLNDEAVSRELVTADDLYHELDELEDEYFDATNKDNLPPFYELLLNKIYTYVKSVKNMESHPEKKLLKYLYTATLSRKNFLEEDVKPVFIVNVGEFLKDLQGQFDKTNEKFTKAQMIENMQMRVNNYKNEIEKESEQAKNLTQGEMKKDLQELSTKIEGSMKKLQNEIQEEKKQKRKEGETLKEAQSKLLTDLIVKSSFQVVKVLNAGLACAGPHAAAASALIAPGLDFAETFATKGAADRKKKVAAIGADIGKAVKEVQTQMKAIEELKEKAKDKKKKCLLKELAKESKNEPVVGLSWKSLSEEDIDRLTGEEVDKKLKEGKEVLAADKTGKFGKFIAFVQKNEKLLTQAGDSVINVVSAIQEYSSEKDRLGNLIEENKELFQKLEDFEKNVYPVLIEELQGMSENFKNLGQDVGKKTKIDFDVSRKNMQFVLEETRKQLLTTIGKYESSVSLILAIEKLEKILPYLYTSNSVIKDYLEQQNLADLLHDLNAETGEDENDKKINKLDAKVYSNILLKKYKMAYQTLEQFVFPFADKFLKNLSHPDELGISGNITEAVKHVEDKLIIINQKLAEYKTQITTADEALLETDFHSRRNSTIQFYRWENENYIDVIRKLLAGEEVYLNADIMKSSFSERNAVKFDEIELYLKIENEMEQTRLNEMLSFFEIKLTHLGDNHYKFKDKMYTVRTASLGLYYSFEYKDLALTQRITKNSAYTKLKNGDVMLSPYATWKAKIHDIGKKKKFSVLAPFADKINLELGGHGTYVKQEDSFNFYHQYKTMQTCDLIPEKSEEEHSRRKREAGSALTRFFSFL